MSTQSWRQPWDGRVCAGSRVVPLLAAPAAMRRGRGTEALIGETRLCPQQQKTGRGGGAPEMLPQAHIHGAQGALTTMQRWLQDRQRGPGVAPREVLCAWQAARKRPRRFQELLGPEFAAIPMPEGGGSLPREGPLMEAVGALRRMAKDQRAREDRGRMQAWRAWLEEAWSSDQGTVYHSLGGEGFAPPVVFRAREDGSPTADVAEMGALVRQAWAPINQKCGQEPEPYPKESLRAYGRHIRCVPMQL